MQADADGAPPRRRNTRPGRREVPNEDTKQLSEAEWRALVAAAEQGRLEDVEA